MLGNTVPHRLARSGSSGTDELGPATRGLDLPRGTRGTVSCPRGTRGVCPLGTGLGEVSSVGSNVGRELKLLLQPSIW